MLATDSKVRAILGWTLGLLLVALGTLHSGGSASAATPISKPLADTKFLPQVGDSWTYRWRRRDRYTKVPSGAWEEFDVQVVSVKGRTVVDTIVGKDEKTESGEQPELVSAVGTSGYILSPYLFDLLDLQDNTKWSNVSLGRAGGKCSYQDYSCSADVYDDGTDDVTVPAGKFDANKVDIVMHINHPGGVVKRSGTIWYDRATKRFVRMEWHTDHGPWADDDVEMELVRSHLQ